MRRGTPRRSEQNQSLDEEIGKIPEQLPGLVTYGSRIGPNQTLQVRIDFNNGVSKAVSGILGPC